MGFSVAPGFFEALAAGVEQHADDHALTGLGRAVFIARGGHAVGEGCSLIFTAQHYQGCAWFMDEECDLGCWRLAL